jgi:hypothetical protein
LERRNELELGHPETIACDQACRTPVRYLFRAG